MRWWIRTSEPCLRSRPILRVKRGQAKDFRPARPQTASKISPVVHPLFHSALCIAWQNRGSHKTPRPRCQETHVKFGERNDRSIFVLWVILQIWECIRYREKGARSNGKGRVKREKDEEWRAKRKKDGEGRSKKEKNREGKAKRVGKEWETKKGTSEPVLDRGSPRREQRGAITQLIQPLLLRLPLSLWTPTKKSGIHKQIFLWKSLSMMTFEVLTSWKRK